jgi:muramoyltetrapeptide carboxypeptidase
MNTLKTNKFKVGDEVEIVKLDKTMQRFGGASLLKPVGTKAFVTWVAVTGEEDPCSLYLRDILFGKLPGYKCHRHKLNHLGQAKGILRGGNMAVFHGLRGTPYDIPPEGTILFIEDVGERPYAIERMMYNLKLGGVLEKLSGLIIGQFTEYKEDYSLKKDLYSTLDALVKEYDFPICYDFPVGHVTENLPLINGAEVEFVSGKKGVELLINPPI